MKIWIGALSGTFLAWGLALLHIIALEMDVRPFGLLKDERTYPILINVFFVVLLGGLTMRSAPRWKTKVLSLVVSGLSFACILLIMGLECVIFGIFGSPEWGGIQKWASKKYPEKTWVQEPWRVPQSGCGGYCQDVHTWIKIRTMVLD